MNKTDNLLHKAFVSFMKYYLSKYDNEKTVKRRKNRMDDAYESFLKGNWNSVTQRKKTGLKVSDTFGSLG